MTAAKALRVGNPQDERTQMDPLISSSHRAVIERYVAIGLLEGGQLLCGGKRPAADALQQGYFYRLIYGFPPARK